MISKVVSLPENYQSLDVRHKLSAILDAMDSIYRVEFTRDMRRRFASESQYCEEYDGLSEKDIAIAWVLLKKAYLANEMDFISLVETLALLPRDKEYFEVLKKICDEEAENVILEDEDEG